MSTNLIESSVELEKKKAEEAEVIVDDDVEEVDEVVEDKEKDLLEQYHHFLALLRPHLEAATGLPISPATLESAFNLDDARALLKQCSLTDLLFNLGQQPVRLRYQPQVVVISSEEELKKLLKTETSQEEVNSSSKIFSAEEAAEESAEASVVRTEEIYYFPNKLQFVTEQEEEEF